MADDTMSASFAYDISAINRLKYSSRKSSDGGVAAASKQFEALFLKEILSSMRKAMPKSDLLGDSSAQKQYQDMMDTQWSQKLADDGGIGLAKMIEHQLARHPADKSAANAAGVSATHRDIPKAQPRSLKPSESLAAIRAQREAATSTADTSATNGPKEKSLTTASTDTGPVIDVKDSAVAPLLSLVPTPGGPAASAKIQNFVDRLGGPAQRAAHRTGLSSRLILAQAALETGWGRHEITTDSGRPSFNVFNIKSTGWQGASTDVATHEYSDGIRHATTDGFRVYDSYDQAFDDYARLIDSSPRYAEARQADSPQAAARALQDGGYATDPNYANKLVSVMKAIPETASAGGLFANGSDAPVVDLSSRGGQSLV